MTMKLKSKEEQIQIAKKSSCTNELWDLHDSIYMNVRRAVARNNNITTQIANKLAVDPVLNVSYMALKNAKTTEKRDFTKIDLTVCITCEKDEGSLDCTACEYKRKYR